MIWHVQGDFLEFASLFGQALFCYGRGSCSRLHFSLIPFVLCFLMVTPGYLSFDMATESRVWLGSASVHVSLSSLYA